jgi:glutamine synthetase
VDAVIAGGPLDEFKAEKKMQPTGCKASMAVESNVEDRNRTAPFPFCGNRYEFRAVGSSQNCIGPGDDLQHDNGRGYERAFRGDRGRHDPA